MIDLNQMLSSILTIGCPENNSALKELSSLEKDSLDEQVPLEVGAFMMLLSQMPPNEPKMLETKECLKISVADNLETQTSEEKTSLASFEDNIAIAWFNSPYLKPEFSEHVLEKPASEKKISSNPVQNLIPKNNPEAFWDEKLSFEEKTFTEAKSLALSEIDEVLSLAGEHLLEFNLDTDAKKPHISFIKEQDPLVFNKYSVKESQNLSFLNPKKETPLETLEGDTTSSKVLIQENSEKEMYVKEANLIKTASTELQVSTSEELPAMPMMEVVRQKNDTSVNSSPTFVKIPLEVEHPKWPTQFSEQIIWLGQQDVKKAIVHVHPAELGPLEIQIQFENEIASVNITTTNHQLREIVDSSLLLLQDLMQKQGLSLGEVHVDVGKDLSHSHQHREFIFKEADFKKTEETVQISTIESVRKNHNGRIDYFA